MNNVQILGETYCLLISCLRKLVLMRECLLGDDSDFLAAGCDGRLFSPGDMSCYLALLADAASMSKKCLRTLRFIRFKKNPTLEQIHSVVEMREYSHEDILRYLDRLHSEGELPWDVECSVRPCFDIGVGEAVISFTYRFSDRAVYEMYQRTCLFEIRSVSSLLTLLGKHAHRNQHALIRTFLTNKWQRLHETPLLYSDNSPECLFRLLYRSF